MSVSPEFNVRVLPNDVIGNAAINLAPYSWSAALSVPSLGQLVARLDPENSTGVDYPDWAGTDRAWTWGSRFCWDPVLKRAIGIVSPHPAAGIGGNDNGYLTLLSFYDAATNAFVVMESPFGNNVTWPRSVAHIYDNQCIGGRTLYKWTQPAFVTGQGAVQPQITKINLDALTTDMTSGRLGAAYIGSIPPSESLTAGALDYLPGCNCLVTVHRSRLLIYDLTAGAWLANVSLGFPVGTYHNIAHYHPQVGKLVGGGGAATDSGGSSNTAWVSVDGTTRAVTRLDDSPVVFSVLETDIDGVEMKASGTYDPNSTESIFFHDNGNIYGLDSTRATGAQWRVIGANTSGIEADWVCALPDYGCILVGHSTVTGGGATLRLYRGA